MLSMARRDGACSWTNPLGDLMRLFPELPKPRKVDATRPPPIPLLSTVAHGSRPASVLHEDAIDGAGDEVLDEVVEDDR